MEELAGCFDLERVDPANALVRHVNWITLETDEALLDEVVSLAAGDEVRAGLEAHEAGVAAEQCVHRGRVSVASAEDEP